MNNRLLAITCGLLVLLFTYTAAGKLIDIRGFAYDMHNQPLPRWFSSLLVGAIPAIEILIVFCLLFDHTRLAGLWSSMVLLLLFTVYTILILMGTFHRIPCGCGGVIKLLTWKQHLLFNLFFIAITAYAIRLQRVQNLFMHENRRNRKPV